MLGQLETGPREARLKLPALLSFIKGRPLIIKASGAAKARAVQAIESLLLRLAATIPPGKLCFTFVDPVGLGQNVAAFMHLGDYDERLVTGKAWTEPHHIEQRLTDLTEHMETVIQKHLRKQYATIEDYNAQADEVAEPYRVLVVMDFPVNFREDAARRLVSIAQNGPRCGVYAVVLVDTAQPLPHGFNLAELERVSTVITWDGQRWVWEDEDFRDCTLELDTPPSPEFAARILKTVGEAAKQADRVEVPFERVFQLYEGQAQGDADPWRRGVMPVPVVPADPATWWHGSTRTGLLALLGRQGAKDIQRMELKELEVNALMAGRPRSGKSNLLHVLITGSALTYSPDELQLYLVDFKGGVEFKPYATYGLPHARVVAIESEREFGLSVLHELDDELTRRGDLFRSVDENTIASYRAKTGAVLPRILLIVDEFQEFFTEDDAIASQAAQVLDRLVRQGSAFGMHVLLVSQTLAGAYTLPRATMDLMAVRIAFQCADADSRLILGDDNPAARLLSSEGEAIYNAANGRLEGNGFFQAAWLPRNKLATYLQRIHELAQARGYAPPQPQIIFEGNAAAQVEQNRPLHDLLTAATWPAPARALRAWLGEPVAIHEPVAALFRRQSSSNLLLVGQRDEAAAGAMATALVSLAASVPPLRGTTQFVVLDFSLAEGPSVALFSRVAGLLPQRVAVTGRRGLAQVIGELAEEVERRLSADHHTVPPLFLFVYGLQRARDLRPDDDLGFPSFGSEQPPTPRPAKQFATIVREGPEVGMHTLVWCDTVTNLNRSLDRRSLREFGMRVAFQMSAEDSANLIDTPSASRLGPYRALYYSEDEGIPEKFRPYDLPSDAWLEQVRAGIARKDTASST